MALTKSIGFRTRESFEKARLRNFGGAAAGAGAAPPPLFVYAADDLRLSFDIQCNPILNPNLVVLSPEEVSESESSQAARGGAPTAMTKQKGVETV